MNRIQQIMEKTIKRYWFENHTWRKHKDYHISRVIQIQHHRRAITKLVRFFNNFVIRKPRKWTLDRTFLRYNDGYEFFDSYGNAPDYDLSHWLTSQERLKLGESQKYLCFLLQGKPYVYNKIRYHVMKRGVNTCGSHVAYRCWLF